MKKGIQILCIIVFFYACKQNPEHPQTRTPEKLGNSKALTLINPNGENIVTRFISPKGYERTNVEVDSFGEYLRQLPLKPHGTVVLYYNGSKKLNSGIYDAVVDLDIGSKDLHQCADAIIRLRADYLWGLKLYDEIHFNFTNGFRVDYSEWIKGNRIVVKGNKTSWQHRTSPSNTYQDYWNYLELIFTYAGTRSLSKELNHIKLKELKIGDIFIKGGSPGHAIIIVDLAVNPKTKEKIFLLAQSYMPAQEIQILKNPNDKSISPWYSNSFNEILKTPEWVFSIQDLKRFAK